MFHGQIRLIAVCCMVLAAGTLNAQSGAWVEETAQAAWPGRFFHAAEHFDSKLWVLGGLAGPPSNDIWTSPDGAAWTQVTPVGSLWNGRYDHGTAVFDNKLWVLGGFDIMLGRVNDVWSSPDGVNWTQAAITGPVWSARSQHAVCVFGNRLWVLGGDDASGEMNDVWSSTDGINWTEETAAALWPQRKQHGVIAFNNQLWVMGGDGASYLNDIWTSVDGIQWTQVTPGATMWNPRTYVRPAVYNNRLWIVGGTNVTTGPGNDVWSSPDGVNWTQEPVVLWANRMAHAVAASADRMWVLGGLSGPTSLQDVWSYTEPKMEVERNMNAVANGGVDSLGDVLITGELFTYEVHNAGGFDLSLTGTPLVDIAPGAGAPTVNVTIQPSTLVAPSGMTTFEIEVVPAIGAFDFTISIASSDPGTSPYVFTVDGNGLNPNQAAEANPASGSSFISSGVSGPFTLALAPDGALAAADIELTDPEADNITVVAIMPPAQVPTGIVEPPMPAPGHPLVLSWTGTADATNAPGDYVWSIDFEDAGSSIPVSILVTITIIDVPPEHAILTADGGDGSAGDPYTTTFFQGDPDTLTVELASLSDANIGQNVSLDSFAAGAGNPAGGAGFSFSVTAGVLSVAPAGALTADDAGTHTFDVDVTDGNNVERIVVSILVYSASGAITFTTPSPLPVARQDRAYDQTIAVAGATGATSFSLLSGALIPGLALEEATGRIHGTPVGSGAVTFTIRVIDGANDSATRQYQLVVQPPPSGSSSDSGCTASGGVPPWAALILAAVAVAVSRRRRASRS